MAKVFNQENSSGQLADNYLYTSMQNLIIKKKEEEAKILKLLEEDYYTAVQINYENRNLPSLSLAIDNQFNSIALALIKNKKTDVNIKCGEAQETLLMRTSNIEIIKALLERDDLDINATDSCGNTALISASRNNDYELVKCLMENYKTNINIGNSDSLTAFTWAKLNGNSQIIAIFSKRDDLAVNQGNNTSFTGKPSKKYSVGDLMNLFTWDEEEVDNTNNNLPNNNNNNLLPEGQINNFNF